ncbi:MULTISPECIES: TonB-dependent receptor domain-containing protein [Sphingobium]|uniref:TonB-dependent receptor n=1 Tax=Sphingobium fuliginis (strain ATCC 27551) TaxID=336203 RepID=A0ABQ1FC76_SPHSA|nr:MULTISPECIES: TonB-dependent receptor [Sphingobium]RYL95566.1 TonB-dependent receptor [Sphingobium fuliginis]WDA37068.1 outer membrane beta-barrel protein [Sphingobium sp. YC-XJ3]GGA06642.1 TonB-dependent receptor [Sphingobium fuliginis]
MSKPLSLARLLLISTALSAPAAMAQNAPRASRPATSGTPTASEEADAQSGNVDVSIPGSDIIVTGRRTSNVSQAAPQVVNVLSAADIKRTGEGDIAGSLQRVTGLSVVSGGYVYVRGLGDRYSLALLNGSPLPSPEPLKRVVPLDIFPTSVIASTLVQKSYSANFPGEFGGGVINLTTKAIPVESYLEITLGSSANTETSGQLGYTHYGSKSDWTGFDDGTRDVPPALKQAIGGGTAFSNIPRADLRAIAMQFQNADTSLLQRTNSLPFNFSASLNGGTSLDVGGDGRLGIIATASYSNKWRTRDTLQQAALDVARGAGRNNRQVSTENEVTVNGLLGFGLELGDQKLRWTNLYIRDTLKRSALAIGQNDGLIQGADYMTQQTGWYERQLIDTQLVGEFKFSDALSLDIRGGYANSQREAPYEREFVYVRTNRDLGTDPVGDRFINALNRQRGDASITFSDLNEDLWSAGWDLSYKFSPALTTTIGYAFTDTKRSSSRYELHFDATNLPLGAQQMRLDYLLSDAAIQLYDISLLEFSGNYPVYDAALRTHAGYAQVKAELFPGLSFDAGVRFEKGRQSVTGVDVYSTGITPFNQIRKEYWLPAATITLEAAKGLQFRLSGSKTVARPQFRELIAQPFLDPESNRFYRGNPFLQDSELWNADLRTEWYMGRDERLTAAAFYKKIENPIETFTTITDTYSVTTSFANAPEAKLYGFEVEAQKYLPLEGLSNSPFFQSRRVVLIGNYTYTQSELKVGADDTTIPYSYTTGPLPLASDYFQNGVPLTGQSDHLVNFQIGLEDTDRLSQQTLLLTYASPRVTSRGPNLQPDIKEKPGLTLDFVARQAVKLPGGINSEFKFEARNLTGRKFQEFQELDGTKIFYNRYKIGTTIAASLTVAF